MSSGIYSVYSRCGSPKFRIQIPSIFVFGNWVSQEEGRKQSNVYSETLVGSVLHPTFCIYVICFAFVDLYYHFAAWRQLAKFRMSFSTTVMPSLFFLFLPHFDFCSANRRKSNKSELNQAQLSDEPVIKKPCLQGWKPRTASALKVLFESRNSWQGCLQIGSWIRMFKKSFLFP
jgi:hypothetical protein